MVAVERPYPPPVHTPEQRRARLRHGRRSYSAVNSRGLHPVGVRASRLDEGLQIFIYYSQSTQNLVLASTLMCVCAFTLSYVRSALHPSRDVLSAARALAC
eukprot:355814-Chlamydomonas_euryale.AAC.7